MSWLELKIPPVLLTLIFGALMWLLSRFAPESFLSATQRITCLLTFGVAAAFVGLYALISFRKARTSVNPLNPHACTSLVDSGIFRFTRNPMYLALVLGLVGWGLFLGNRYSLALAAFFVAYMNRFQIRPEERALETLFGEAYHDYRHRVRRWI